MSNYSYSEIQNMQKRAMERVREMQKNSESVLETARQDLGERTIEPKNEMPRTDAKIMPKITNLPPNFPDFKDYFHMQTEETPPAPQKEEKTRQPEPQNNIFDLISTEPDRALLLGLLLLLKSEGADEVLMMALMYIMA